ncbi:Exosome non-catalytic core component [Malassezia yamatoensis]|uniref:Exosome non-catalytic core component n=1 Tax=Malassezia yamatoensis TaxID=253288 RepID=A0AAJ6CFM6_9BASI|nr:Exosome non-catalytic core component [Malassezia yamatoensis]
MDGRRPLELRSMEFKLSPHLAGSTSLVPTSASAAGRPDGSAQVTQGLTSVCVYIYGPREPGRVSRAPTVRQDRAGIHVEIAVAPWGGIERRHRTRNDRLNGRTLFVIPLSLWYTLIYIRDHRSMWLCMFCNKMEVSESEFTDQGVLPAAINACTLALMDAGIPMSDYVAALTCGLYGSTPLLDLNLTEQSDLPFVTLAVQPRSGKVPLMLLDTRIHIDRFSAMVGISVDAARVIRDEMDIAMRHRTELLAKAMHGVRPKLPTEEPMMQDT